MFGHPVRKRLRLAGFDYAAPGAYFVTVCTHGRLCLLGEVREGIVCLNGEGEIVRRAWLRIPVHFSAAVIDALVVMPNHLHALILLGEIDVVGPKPPALPEAWAPPHGSQPRSIQAIVQNAKSVSARQINVLRGTPGALVWQRSYYEHIVRSQGELDRLRRYVASNPLRWEFDREHPSHR